MTVGDGLAFSSHAMVRIVFAATRQDATAAGFDDAAIYSEVARPHAERQLPNEQALPDEAREPFQAWAANEDRIPY